jgi:hypothetical protein
MVVDQTYASVIQQWKYHNGTGMLDSRTRRHGTVRPSYLMFDNRKSLRVEKGLDAVR